MFEEHKHPFLLLDGHHSRLEFPFLEYIHDNQHKWTACIGVPYVTHWWQVADSLQLNGSYNMEICKAKRTVFAAKYGKGLQKTDIVPLVRMAWKNSFGDVEKAARAIRACGWNPLNYALLTNKDLVTVLEAREMAAAKSVAVTNNSSVSAGGVDEDLTTLNTETGTAQEYLDVLLRRSMRDDGARERIQKRKAVEEQTGKKLDLLHALTGKKLSSGVLLGTGDLHLSQALLQKVQHDKDNEAAKSAQKEHEHNKCQRKQQEVFKGSLDKVNRNLPLTTNDLRVLLKHLKQPGDNKLPTKTDELWKGKADSPVQSPSDLLLIVYATKVTGRTIFKLESAMVC